MFFCRYWLIIPMLAIAGSLSAKKIVPATQGTLPTHTPLFVFFCGHGGFGRWGIDIFPGVGVRADC